MFTVVDLFGQPWNDLMLDILLELSQYGLGEPTVALLNLVRFFCFTKFRDWGQIIFFYYIQSSEIQENIVDI